MPHAAAFVDIHCHLIPEIDDGARSWDESLAMAAMAADDGIAAIIATPHQLGTYAHNSGELIRQRTLVLQSQLDRSGIPLRVLPGADVRIEVDLVSAMRSGNVVTLADRGRHVLLELPHELYFPLGQVLDDLRRAGVAGILSHPERNQGLLKQPSIVESLVDAGCLMQVTAGSLIGGMGAAPQEMAEWMLARGLVHFIATDAHGPKARRPLMGRAFERVAELTDAETAAEVCCHNPARVCEGLDVPAGRRQPTARRRGLARWFSWRKAS
jgi:protein-tyrosine phosphatase